jgi:hypothetical protein
MNTDPTRVTLVSLGVYDPICALCNIAASTVVRHYPLTRRELIEQGRDPNDRERCRALWQCCHDMSKAAL